MVRQELELLLDALPRRVVEALHSRDDLEELLEIVLDLGKVPEARFVSGDVPLTDDEVTQIAGNRDKMSGKLQERYGWTKTEVDEKMNDFFRRHV